MEVGYKVFRAEILKGIDLKSKRFGFEPEITMKCAKRKLRIYEAPISYHGRTYEEGKKIGWKDGVKALGVILKFWLIDDLYVSAYGRGMLNNLTGTPQYLNWIVGLIRKHLGDTVLEVGAGIGNMTGRLMGRRLRYVTCEKDPLYLHALRNRFLRTPSVEVRQLDAAKPEEYSGLEGEFDSALCLNVLEYVDDPRATIGALRDCLKAGGALVVLVPHGRSLFGSVDETLGHRRRFEKQELAGLLEEAGLTVTHGYQLNKIGKPPWWFYGRVLGRRRINKLTLKLFDKTVWLWKLVEPALPWNGLTLVMVAKRQ